MRNSLKGQLNDLVFSENTFNEERMVRRVLQRVKARQRGIKKGYLFAIAAACVLVLLLAVPFLRMPMGWIQGAGPQSVHQLIEKYPDLKKDVDKLSPAFKRAMRLPSKFPFKVKHVSVLITTPHALPGMELPEDATFLFGDGKNVVEVGMQYAKKKKVRFDSAQTVKLKDGTEAYWHKTKNGWSIAWHDEDVGIVYNVLILSASGKNPFTKEDLMMVANSMR